MNIYEAAKKVEEHVIKNALPTTVQATSIYGVYKEQVIKFKSEQEAVTLNDNSGYLFKTLYRNGSVEVTPFM